MSSIDQILGLLRAARTALGQAATDTHQAARQAGQIRDVGRATGVHGVAERFERLRARVEQVEAMISAGVTMVEQAIAETEATRGGGGSGTAAAAASGPPARSPAMFRPSFAEQVRPRRTKQTFGVATTSDGDPLHTGELVSGHPRNAPVDPRVGIRDPRTRSLTAVSMHVEGQVAAMMRRPGGPQDVVLYVNNEVCRGRDGGRGCHEVLPGILPANSRLTVYTVEGGRRISAVVYEGDGSEL